LICASVCRESSFKQTQKFNDRHLEKYRAPIGAFSFAIVAAAAPADALWCDVRHYEVQQIQMGKIAWRSQAKRGYRNISSIYPEVWGNPLALFCKAFQRSHPN